MVHSFLDSSIHNHNAESIQVHRSFSIHSQSCEAGLTDVQQNQTINLTEYKTFDTEKGRNSAESNSGTRIFREDVASFPLIEAADE